jgi:hypothetical protein
MTIQEIKNNIIKETKELKRWENTIRNTITPIAVVGCAILGGVLGMIFGGYENYTILMLGVVCGWVVAFVIIKALDPNGVSEKADVKAKEISMSYLLPIFSRAVSTLVKNEQSISTFEKHLKEAAEEEYVTQFDNEGKLKTDWGFNIKQFEAGIQRKSGYIYGIAVNEDLSSTTKTIIQVFCNIIVEVTEKNDIENLIAHQYLITIE